MNWLGILTALIFSFYWVSGTFGQSSMEIQVVADNLLAPCGVAVQPETGMIFVADSGNGRIIRVGENGIKEEIVGFPKAMSPHLGLEVGPLGITFLDKETLLVGCAVQEPDSNDVLVYRLRDRPKALNFSNSESKHEFPTPDSESGSKFFWGLTLGGTNVIATCEGTKDWLAIATLSERSITDLKPLLNPADHFKTKAPATVVRSPQGFLTVGFAGDRDEKNDSLLAFLEEDGKFLGSAKLGLVDVAGLSYGPNRKQLFAIDYNHSNPDNGALFRITEPATSDICEKTEILKLDRPTAMVFDSQGNLYITLCGKPIPGSNKNPGSLIKISGLDLPPMVPNAKTKGQ